MAAAKETSTKGVAAVCFCKREPYQLPTLERHVKAAGLQKASVAEEVKSKLERIEGMLDSFQEEVFNAGMIGVQVGQRMGPSEEQMLSDERIAVLDHDIESLMEQLQKQIGALRGSKEISRQESYEFEKQLSRLEERYIDSARFGNEL